MVISTHAPARGATRIMAAIVTLEEIFQPTLPHGERRVRLAHFCARCNFNPRSRTGSDHAPLAFFCHIAPFQPTLPHGERHF